MYYNKEKHRTRLIDIYSTNMDGAPHFDKELYLKAIQKLEDDDSPEDVEAWVNDILALWYKQL